MATDGTIQSDWSVSQTEWTQVERVPTPKLNKRLDANGPGSIAGAVLLERKTRYR